MPRRSSATTLLLVLGLAVLAEAARATEEDHPLVTRYPGSTVAARDVEDFGTYTLVVGLVPEGMQFEGKALEGVVTRLTYANPSDRSTLEIFRNYREALEKAGAQILWTCEDAGCGPAYARSAWGRFNGLTVTADGDPRYLAARVARGTGEAYVAVMVGKRRTQLDVVEIAGMDRGLVAVDPDALGQDIERDGSVRIYGILFDVDRTEIRPESTPTLDAIAAMLKAKPQLALFVVGHTDGTGTLGHNMELSKGRARAVVQALTGRYGVAPSRLDGHGVGPLAPVATNATEAGRQKNRRVELVAR